MHWSSQSCWAVGRTFEWHSSFVTLKGWHVTLNGWPDKCSLWVEPHNVENVCIDICHRPKTKQESLLPTCASDFWQSNPRKMPTKQAWVNIPSGFSQTNDLTLLEGTSCFLNTKDDNLYVDSFIDTSNIWARWDLPYLLNNPLWYMC